MHDAPVIRFLNHVFAAVSIWSLRHRWWVFSSCLLILAASVLLSANVRMDNGFESFFNSNDPAYKAYLQYRDDFGSDEIAYLVYDASDYEHGVFNLELMQTIQALTTALDSGLPFVKEVRSLVNAEMIVGVEDGIEIIKLEDDFPETQDALLAFGQQVLSKEMYVGGLVSADGRYGAIQVDMLRSSIDPIEKIQVDPAKGTALENLYPQATDSAIAAVLAKPQFQQLKLHISGDVVLGSAFNRITYGDMYLAFSLCFLVIAVLLAVFFSGQIIGIIGPLAVVLLTIVITLGFMGSIGWDMDMMFAMTPTLITALGVANAVHIISEFRHYYAQTGDRQTALRQTFYLIGTPCLLTSLTTAAGFLSLSVSPIKAIEHMAIYTAMASIAAFFLSLSLLSFFLSFGKKAPAVQTVQQPQNRYIQTLLSGIANLNLRHYKAILFISALLTIGMGYGISRIEVDSNFLLDFSKDVPVRKATETVDDIMGGTGSLVYLFDTGTPDGIKNPALLKEMDQFQQYAANHSDMVKKTYSLANLIKDIHQGFHNNDPAYYAIPDDADLIAQYLLVYEVSGGEELHNFISNDQARAALEVRTRMANSSDFAALKQALDGFYQHTIDSSEADVQFTGMAALWLQLVDYITISQIYGAALAFTVITLIMCLIFRSVRIGLISMIPNIIPVTLTLGFMGWINLPLDYMKLLIAPVALSIAVDDTIHLMTRLHHEFRQSRNYSVALHRALSGVGRAITITSVILVAGFSMFAVSQMDSQFWFGTLLAGTILLALIADFLIVPSLILWLKPFGEESDEQTP